MATSNLVVTSMGQFGVNVDKNPLELGDSELIKAQNATVRVTSESSLSKRPGLVAFNTTLIAAGSVLGGISLPVRNTSSSGVRSLYIGRGPTS